MRKLTTLFLVMTLLGGSLSVTLANTTAPLNNEKEKVYFDIKMHDSLGSNAEQWENSFVESATKAGYEIVEADTEDSTKVTVFIGKDDEDDDNDGVKDTVDNDDDGDGRDDSTQNVGEHDLDTDIPQLLENGKNENKNEGVYFAVVGENGKMNIFRSDIDDFNFSDKAESANTFNGAIFQNASYSKASNKRAFPIIFAARITFQVVKLGFQIYSLTRK